MADEQQGNIPLNFVEFGEAVAKLATAAGFHSLSITVHPSYEDQWRQPVQITWGQGRRGSDVGRLRLESNVTVVHNFQDTAR